MPLKNKSKSDEQWFKKLFATSNQETKKKIPLHYVLLVGCVGLMMMLLANWVLPEEERSLNETPSEPVYSDPPRENDESDEVEETFGRSNENLETMQDYEMRYENQLRDILNEITGVSNTTVMITFSETEKKIFEKNRNRKQQHTEEVDREGGTRQVEDISEDEQVVTIQTGDSEEPLLVKTEKPEVSGVLVVARGVENVQVKSFVVEAVSRVLDVPAHRVSVMPKKIEEDE
ncbi:stage III sporulation protein AG [Alkalihalobacillus pseudalcaliphilus]|uniref:stage III sporulation protein AG n=1 Tax=Alkalihalobacillus pseudalcaliphilus TaxID=79884 RepID=UPI000AEED75D|nr:stage III sporulation protein AG [Alkalihalobacillus pseudalcaliphilus]